MDWTITLEGGSAMRAIGVLFQSSERGRDVRYRSGFGRLCFLSR